MSDFTVLDDEAALSLTAEGALISLASGPERVVSTSIEDMVSTTFNPSQGALSSATDDAPMSYSDGMLCMCPGCMGLIDLGTNEPVAVVPTRGGGTTFTFPGQNGRTIPSYDTTQAGAYITRDNSRWSGATADGNGGLPQFGQASTVTYAFAATARNANGTGGFSQFTAQQIAVAEQGLASWSDVANITFTRVGSGTSGAGAFSNDATILFQNYTTGAAGAAAFAYFPGQRAPTAASGDVYVNFSLTYNANPTLLNYGFLTMTHEIGHAIGLNHPGNYNAGEGVEITYENSSNYREDTLQYSVMSYFAANRTGANHGTTGSPNFSGYPSAPMLDDISAAQRLYGANMTTRTGNDTYGFNNTTGRAWFGPAGPNNTVIFAVWDAGGNDTFDFSGYTQTQEIDLRATSFSSVGGLTFNVAIALGVTIENAVGGSGNDLIIGNEAANLLIGGAGNDVLEGGDGGDGLYGGEGLDRHFGGAGDDRIAGFTGGDLLDGGVGDDQLFGEADADQLIGGDGNDVLDGGEGDDNLSGGAGLDRLLGGLGVDYMTGGLGGDFLDGEAGDDTLFGEGDADFLAGGSGNDVLEGGDGDDGLYGGEGLDRHFGGAGNDRIAGFSGGDFLDGGTGDDALFGESEADFLAGGEGNDVLDGGDGDDGLYGGEGLDRHFGGAGNDRIAGFTGGDFLDGGTGDDQLFGESEADQLIGGEGNDVLDGGEGDDNLAGGAGLDRHFGGNGGDYITGGAGGDLLDGGAGDDILFGEGEADQMIGGLGSDFLDGGAGDDNLTGGAGADSLIGGAGADRFVYTSTSESTGGPTTDRIVDFAAGDIFDVAAIDANVNVAGDQGFNLVGGFSGQAGQAIFVFDAGSNTTFFAGDVNGDGVADFVVAFSGNVTSFSSGLVL